MYEVITTKSFEKDVLMCAKRGLKIDLLYEAIAVLGKFGSLPPSYKSHLLSGKQSGRWECHIKPNWLLIWVKDENLKEITLIATGTHSDLF